MFRKKMAVKLHRNRNNEPVLELVFHHLREVLKLHHHQQKLQHPRQLINQRKVKKHQIIQNGVNLPVHHNNNQHHQQPMQAGYNSNFFHFKNNINKI